MFEKITLELTQDEANVLITALEHFAESDDSWGGASETADRLASRVFATGVEAGDKAEEPEVNITKEALKLLSEVDGFKWCRTPDQRRRWVDERWALLQLARN